MKKKPTNKENLPIVLSVKDVKKIMDINITKAYELAHRKDFPAKKLGRRIIIPRDPFLDWLENYNSSS